MELLKPETMRLLKVVHCNVIINDYQQDLRVLYIFVPNKSFGELLEKSTTRFIFLMTFNSEFLYIEIWHKNQNDKPLEISDTVNL